jgi:hypothetical protein
MALPYYFDTDIAHLAICTDQPPKQKKVVPKRNFFLPPRKIAIPSLTICGQAVTTDIPRYPHQTLEYDGG